MENKEYSTTKTYPSRRLTLEFIRRFPNPDWYSTLHKKETQYFKLDTNKDIESYLDEKRTMHSWDERYYKDFIKFTSLQSKSFKKKLIKVVYIFENEQSDKKYRKIFNFLVNYFRINIKKQVHNYDETTKKPIDETKLDYYTDTYYLTDFKRILEPKENRNRLINKILKSNDLVDNNN